MATCNARRGVKSITRAHDATLTPGPLGASASRCNYPRATAHWQMTITGNCRVAEYDIAYGRPLFGKGSA
jgi:hypothetical protein